MVLHIGIDPLNGKVAIYDTGAKSFNKFDVGKVTSNDIGKVKHLFLSIKNQLNQNIGNACVCLDENYENDIRLEFVKQATENDFYQFEIIDLNTALYIHAVSHKLKDYNVFWILWSKKCFIFSQKNEQIFFVKAYSTITKTDIATIKRLQPPQAMFLQIGDTHVVAKELCDPNKFFYYSVFEIEISALSRAKLITSEKDGLNVVTCFGRKCQIFLNKKSFLTVLPDVHLPYEKVIEVEEKSDSNFVKIIENNVNIRTFTFGKQSMLFYINSNGIYYLSEINNFETTDQNNVEKIENTVDVDAFHNHCAAEFAWIESKQSAFSSCISFQNPSSMAELCIKLNSELEERKEKLEELFVKCEPINETDKNCAKKFKDQWNAFHEKYENFSKDLKTVEKLFLCVEKAHKLITKEQNIENDSNSKTTSKALTSLEICIRKLKKQLAEAEKIKEEFENLQLEIKSCLLDFTRFEADLKSTSDGLQKFINRIKEDETNIEQFKEKTEAIYLMITILVAESDTSTTISELEKVLNRILLWNDKYTEIEKIGSFLKSSKYTTEIDYWVTYHFKMQKVMKSHIFCAAKTIMGNGIDISNINDISELQQHILNSKTASLKTINLSPNIDRSSKLDVSLRTFWHERKNRVFNYIDNDDSTYDDNWLKRMSEMPRFDIPEKYSTFDTSINAVGMDLGTSSCCVAVNKRNRIDVAPIDLTGEKTMPSYVGFDEAHVKCGKVVVDHLGTYSKCTIFDSKRIIGKTFAEIDIDPTWPFDVVEDEENVHLIAQGHENTVVRKSAEEIASILILHMKKIAEQFQGGHATSVVITIPASFTDRQKEATITAAKLAGFDKVNLLPEPVAASFAYFIDQPLPNNATILLFDLGGGTLDICIFKVNNTHMQIISNTGDPNIGGRDFDKLLFDYFKNELFQKYEINIEKNEKRKYKLMLKCQDIKHTLSVRFDAGIDVDDYDCSIDGQQIKITRQEFESMSESLLENIQTLLTYATESLEHPVEKVLHVGGSSKIPMINALLETMFPDAKHCCEEHPEEVVAIGAAYYSYHLARINAQN